MKILLEVERKKPEIVRDFSKVEKILRKLKSFGPHSFASLTREDGAYVQVAGGRMTCVLELHEINNKKHWRAFLENPKVPFRETATLVFGGGNMTMEPEEILFIDDVLEVFRAFFESKPYPEQIKWRDMTGMLRNS